MLRNILPFTLVLILCGCAEDPARLELQLEVGSEDAYAYSYEQRLTVAGEEGQADTEMRTKLSYEWRESAVEVAPDSTRLELTIDSVRYEMKAESDGKVLLSDSFDSNDMESNPSLTVRGYAGMVGRSFTIQVDPRGERLELAGYDEMLTTLIGELYNADDLRQSIASQTFARDNSAEAMVDSLAPVFSIYPVKPVRVGDKWTRRTELTTGFPRGRESHFELVEREGGKCRVKVHATIAPLEGEPTTQFGARSARTLLRGGANGELTLDEASGRILVGRLEADLEGTMETLPTDQHAGYTKAIGVTTILDIRRE